jgi:hypothetical protein
MSLNIPAGARGWYDGLGNMDLRIAGVDFNIVSQINAPPVGDTVQLPQGAFTQVIIHAVGITTEPRYVVCVNDVLPPNPVICFELLEANGLTYICCRVGNGNCANCLPRSAPIS